MTIKLKEENGDEIEFSTMAEMLEYKAWKAGEQKSQKVVILSERKPEPAKIPDEDEIISGEHFFTPPKPYLPMGGRKIKNPQWTAERLQELLDSGKSWKQAMQIAGVSRSAFWKRLGKYGGIKKSTPNALYPNDETSKAAYPNAVVTKEGIQQLSRTDQIRQEILKAKKHQFVRDVLRNTARKFGISVSEVRRVYSEMTKKGITPAIGHSIISKNQIDAVKELYDKVKKTPTGLLPRHEAKRMAKQLGMGVNRVKGILVKLKLNDEIPMAKHKTTDRKRFVWARIKQLEHIYPGMSVEKRMSLANTEWERHGGLGCVHAEEQKPQKQEQAKLDKQLEFPGIYPLADHAVKVFEQMVVDLVAKKHSKIDYYLASQNLQLIEGKEWNYHTWQEFCMQFNLSIPRIAGALVGCDARKLRLQKDGTSWVIVHASRV